MKKLFIILVGVIFCCYACNTTVIIPVESISISQNSLELIEGESEHLSAIVNPENASDYLVVWTSSDPTIASVNDGLVNAIKEGVSSITVSAGGKTASCTVSVRAKYIPITSISLNQSSVEMVEGDELTLNASIDPAYATDQHLTWSSSDDNVATVNDGTIFAKGIGTAKITVSVGDKTATCDVTVIKRIIHVESISLNLSQKRLKKGERFTIVTTIFPKDANDYNITFSSANTEIASVSQDGIVEGCASGKTTVSVEAGGKRADLVITVFEQDIIYAITTDWNYNYYVSKLWKNQESVLSADNYTFEELYFIDNQPNVIAHKNTSSEVEYYQIVNGDYRHFNPGANASRNICLATALYNGDIYSIVEWDYQNSKSSVGVWRNTEKLFDIGDEYKMSSYSYCSFGNLFFDGGEMYIVGSIMEPVSETSKAEFPTIWKDGNIYKQFDVRGPDASWGGGIWDVEIVNGKRYYLMTYGGPYWQNHLAVYDDNGKLYDLCPEAEHSDGQLCSYNGKLYAISTSSFNDSNELRLSVYEDGVLLFTLPNVESATFDIVEGDLYFLVIERRLWGGTTYYSESVYRGENKEYTLIEETTDALYSRPIKVFKGK